MEGAEGLDNGFAEDEARERQVRKELHDAVRGKLSSGKQLQVASLHATAVRRTAELQVDAWERTTELSKLKDAIDDPTIPTRRWPVRCRGTTGARRHSREGRTLRSLARSKYEELDRLNKEISKLKIVPEQNRKLISSVISKGRHAEPRGDRSDIRGASFQGRSDH